MASENNALAILYRAARECLDQSSTIRRGLCGELLDWIIYGEGPRPFGYVELHDRGRIKSAVETGIHAATADSGMSGVFDQALTERLNEVTAPQA